ncbi:NCK-interacting protein with SH3 domain [Halotydeus destructor]|nr:NCK-interacting protein with SH3 domain [Halotydeus destructor]
MSSSQLVKAIYDYDADPNDGKVLSCSLGELFIVIKASKPQDWLYVVNCSGRLGYIPANFVQNDELEDSKYLEFIDSVVGLLEKKPSNDMITVRQINHAQVKLTQLRCEVVQRIYGNSGPSPEIIFVPNSCGPPLVDLRTVSPVSEPERSPKESSPKGSIKELRKKRVSFQEEVEEVPAPVGYEDEGTQTDEPLRERKLSFSSEELQSGVPEALIPELVESLRVSTDLSHEMCKTTIELVVDHLGRAIPGWARKCNQIKEKLFHADRTLETPEVLSRSSDAINLKEIFKRLWYCKNDEQQRSWPVHEDEESIQNTLHELTKVLANANPKISRDVICKNSYDNVHMLITYFQMETRRSLRMELYVVLVEVIRLYPPVISDHILSSVLPSTMADEMVNYPSDTDRWNSAALLFTIIFSTGHKPPVNLYDHIGEKFVKQLLSIIEGEDESGEKSDNAIPMETSIPALLAFNLQFTERESNLVLKALMSRTSSSQFTENLVSYLNWEEDPTVVSKVFPDVQLDRPNAVHKILTEIFQDRETSRLFYYNDVRVLIDIIITHLNNLLDGDKCRLSYLKVGHNIILNSEYKEDPHKLDELLKCLDGIVNRETSLNEEKELAQQIRSLLV